MDPVARATPRTLHRVEHIMGMPIGIDVRDESVHPATLDRAFDFFRWVDAVFSTFRQDSEISRLNAGTLTLAEAHAEVRAVLDRCEELRQETGGYFDIRTDQLPVPITRVSGLETHSGSDPSGLVKGWAVDRVAEILDAAGGRNYSINAGGDVRVRGGALPDTRWRIGIQHPFTQDKVAAVVEVTDLAVATSGAYARGHHIQDPHAGNPPTGVLSVSVVGPDLATADAYATAIYAMGTAGPTWAAGLFGYDAMVILEDQTVLSTRWFPAV